MARLGAGGDQMICRQAAFYGVLVLGMLSLAIAGIALVGCGCHSLVTATTDRASYVIGDRVRVAVVNGSSRDIEAARVNDMVLEQHLGARWAVVRSGPVWSGAGEMLVFHSLRACGHETNAFRLRAAPAP